MEFPERLAKLRRERGFSQKQLAEAIGMHVSQIRRYERGSSQPTIEPLKKIAVTLGVGADMLLFGTDGQNAEQELRLQFEALKDLDEEEKKIVKSVLDGLILRHQARRWATR